MLPAIDVIAASIRTSRTEFGRLFLQAQIDAVPNPNDRALFAAVGTSGVDTEAFAAALAHAQVGGWLKTLVQLLVDENLESGQLAHALASEGPDPAALEAMVSVDRDFRHPHLECRGFNSGMQWTAKIMIDGKFQGTGVLVSPHLVLTAWHVVSSLFQPVQPVQPANGANGRHYEPRPNSGARLHVEFDDFLTFVGARPAAVPGKSLRVAAHQQWCVVHSPCHTEELDSRLPSNLRDLDGHWDYAILRLAKVPGIERSWARLDERAVVPTVNGEVVVFQYPGGRSLRLDRGGIVKPEALEVEAVPRLRFLHGVNTIAGTSGGPCFDKAFTLVGLHQGPWGGRPAVNRGVPIVRVVEHIVAEIQRLPVPDPADMPIWHVRRGDYAGPVIGCDEFQGLIWRAALGDSTRIIEIVGAPRSGKTFRLSVLSALLPAAGHLKVELSAKSISKLRAPEVAESICREAGAPAPALSSPEDYDATITTWIRGVVVQQVITALDGVRNGGLVWILISDLNTTEIEGEHVSELLHALYEQTRTVTWLRFVLDGMRGDLPNSVKEFMVRHSILEPTQKDIETYLRRAVAQHGVSPPEDVIWTSAGILERTYQQYRGMDATKAMELLAELAMPVVQDLQQKFVSGVPR